MTFARRNPFPPKLRDQPLPAEIPRLTNPGAFTRCDSMTMTIEKNPPSCCWWPHDFFLKESK